VKKTTRVLIQMGPGGVGKTTVSAAFGFYWAAQGKKVLVMTIDPSKRLAQALGVEGKKGAVRVDYKPGLKGELYAMVLDHGDIFDSFVTKAAAKNPVAEKIFQNKLYQSLKNHLQGSQDFTALIELYQMATTGEYDLIILDTPPAEHAWQFLEAPLRLLTLFQEKIAKWFRWMGGENSTLWSQVVNVGTKQVFKVMELLTGSEFIYQIADFFKAVHFFQDQLRDQIQKSHELLKSSQTEFTLVTTQDELKIKESLGYAQEMKDKGYNLKRIILNRAWPENETDLGLESFSEEKKKQIKDLLNLFKQNQKSSTELMKLWPEDVKVFKIYDTLKSSHNLERLKEMSDDMLRAF
jgi:anion-transporting  ArsA/GET3 family ATPase